MIATKYKIPGLVSWKCVSCSKVKNGYRNLGAELKRKVPLILVDNDIIKEDPERPLNAEHFCNGKGHLEAVVDRARIDFVHMHGHEEPNSAQIRETIQHFAKEAASTAPIPLNGKEKREVQRTLGAKCLPLLHGVNKRRMCKKRKEATQAQFRDNEEGILEHGEGSSSSVQHQQVKDDRSSNKINEKTGEVQEDFQETPRKRRKAASKFPPFSSPTQQPLLVRPLPPMYYVRTGMASQVLPHQHHHHDSHHHSIDYYEDVEIEEEAREHVFDDEELISGDQQQVAYSIEL